MSKRPSANKTVQVKTDQNRPDHLLVEFRFNDASTHEGHLRQNGELTWFCSDDDEFRFNDASTHEGHLRQNGELTWFCSETIIMISHKCIKCKTRTNLKIKVVILC